MENTAVVVTELLATLAAARNVPADAQPDEIITNSLDQMRFLVGLEERLDTVLEVGDTLPFDLASHETLLKSVETLLRNSGDNA